MHKSRGKVAAASTGITDEESTDGGRTRVSPLARRLAAEVGRTRQILIESASQGRTEHFVPVAINGDTPGAVRTLAVTGHDGARLLV